MSGVRQDLPVNYKTQTLRTLVQALKAVFHHKTAGVLDYPEEQFRTINIVSEWPLTQESWPAIVVRFNEGQIKNAGVGHEEEFQDDNGLMRRWMHRQFDGSISFELCALSPFDLMVLSDAMVELIAFGRLNAIWSLFYDKIYGSQSDEFTVLGLLHAVTLNTDIISSQGEPTPTPAPWQPEDVLVFIQSYSIDLWGSFYNTIPTDDTGLPYVQEVDVQSYLDVIVELEGDSFRVDGITEPHPFTDDPDNGWTQGIDYYDESTVVGSAQIDSLDDDGRDSAILGRGVLGNLTLGNP